MKTYYKTLFLIVIAVTTVLTGYTRDYIFRSVNALLSAWDSGIDYPIHPTLSFLKNYSYDTVVGFKWFLTLVFSALFLIILLATLYVLFNKRSYSKIAIACYIALFCVSGIAMSIGYFSTSIYDSMYEFSRFLLGLAQSPIVLMVLVPIFLFAEKQQTKNPD